MPSPDVAIHSNASIAITSPWNFPLREDVAYTDAGGSFAANVENGTRHALERLQGPLRSILEPEEAVLYFARGQMMPEKPERYLLGVPYRVLTRAALILTNRRILHMTLKRDGRWNRKLRCARWGDIAEY